MKRGILFHFIIFILVSQIAPASISLDKAWSITEEAYDWDISYSGKHLGFINKDKYYIYNRDGEIVLKGRNIWKGNYLELTDDKFMLIDYSEFYFRLSQIYDFSGNLIRRFPSQMGAYLSPSGHFILIEYGVEVFKVINSKGQRVAGDMFSEISPVNPYTSYNKSEESYIKGIYISDNERFIVADGIYENQNDSLKKVLDNYITPTGIDIYDINYSDITFINEEYILTQIFYEERIGDSNEYKVICSLYDSNMNLLWKKDNIKGKLYGFDNGFIAAKGKKLTFYNISGQVQKEIQLPAEILKVFTFQGKGYIIAQLSDETIVLDLKGNAIESIDIKAPFVFSPDGGCVYTYRKLERLDIDNQDGRGNDRIEFTCYQINTQ